MTGREIKADLKARIGPHAKIIVRSNSIVVRCKLCKGVRGQSFTCPADPRGEGEPSWAYAVWVAHLDRAHGLGDPAVVAEARAFIAQIEQTAG